MQIPVLIEPIEGNGYRAKGGAPFAFSVEAATREEALERLRQLIEGSLRAGAEVVALEVGAQTNPWLRGAGIFDPDDPLVKEWIEIMEENRRKDEEDPDYP
jgi:hypothetical protein